MLGIEVMWLQREGQAPQSTDRAQAIQQAAAVVVVGTGQGIGGFGLQVRVRHTEGGLVHTFLALASPPPRSTGTAIGIREAEGETPTACCAWALFLAALSKTTLSAG